MITPMYASDIVSRLDTCKNVIYNIICFFEQPI